MDSDIENISKTKQTNKLEITDHNDDDDDDEYNELDQKMLDFINYVNNKDKEAIPVPTNYVISTQSAMCCIDNTMNIDLAKKLDLSKVVSYISKNIISNIIFKKNPDYLIRGIVIENIILRFDESYLKKYKKPYVKFFGNVIDYTNLEDCLLMLNNIDLLESKSLKKQGRQKVKKDNEYFYNSCSIIVKAASDIKCVNIKLFNNGKITLTGSKHELDGYKSCLILLDELKKNKSIFKDLEDQKIDNLFINKYKITMINSDFNTNFKIDLSKLLEILNTQENDIFIKFNPEKYRGLIIGFFWNEDKVHQDGCCNCTKGRCKGKGKGKGDGQCKKITISIFKSGSIIITGGFLVKQIDHAYEFINSLLKKFYNNIIKLSILDFIDEDETLEKESDTEDL